MALNEIETTRNYGFPESLTDLHGMHLRSITSNWWPYIFSENCKSGPMKCKWDGYLVDLFNEASMLMNFTWKSDLTDDWGVVLPVENTTYSGKYHKNFKCNFSYQHC